MTCDEISVGFRIDRIGFYIPKLSAHSQLAWGTKQAAVLAEPLNHYPYPCSEPRFRGRPGWGDRRSEVRECTVFEEYA